jgi:hypothetical protein
MQKLIDRLPFDIIINHILPYTYNTQPNNLLVDIRSYCADYKLVESIYMTQHNEFVLLHDLKKFCCAYLKPYYGMDNKFDSILRRHISIKNRSEEKLINILRLNFHRNVEINTERKVKFIWGLLTPTERTEFINNFILIDDDF